jgi:hypothetical protein
MECASNSCKITKVHTLTYCTFVIRPMLLVTTRGLPHRALSDALSARKPQFAMVSCGPFYCCDESKEWVTA